MDLSIQPAPASGAARARAIAFAAVLFALALSTLPLRLHFVGSAPAFLAAYGIVLTVAEALTGLVLFWYIPRLPRATFLCAAYLFTPPLILANVLTFPGVMPHRELFAYQTTPPWIWAFWHLGWGGFVLCFALATEPAPSRRYLWPALAPFFALGCILAAAYVPFLPPLLARDGSFLPGMYAVYAISLATYLAALAGLAARWRRITPLELWVGVAVLALALDVAFNTLAPPRFSLGTYIARGLAMTSGIVVLVAQFSEMLALLRRAETSQAYAMLVEHLPQVALIVDDASQCVFANAAWMRHTGQTLATATGRGYRSAIHPGDAPLTATGSDPNGLEIRLWDAPTGAYRRHALSIVPMDRLGDHQRFVVTAIDVEDRRRDEERLTGLLARDRQLLARLQAVFAPGHLPRSPRYHLSALYRPSSSDPLLGGDWYDVTELRNGTLAIGMGDVAGHGLDAATVMIGMRESMRALAETLCGRPDLLLEFVNNAAHAANAPLTTALFSFFDPNASTLVYASAGHPAPVLVRDRTATALSSSGIAFGVVREARFSCHQVQLRANDRVIFYTDGIVENDRDPIAGERALMAAAIDTIGAPELVAALIGREQRDDVAVVVLGIPEAGPLERDPATWRFVSDDASSAQAARPSFAAYLTTHGFADADVASAEVIFGELIGNVVRHAPGPIDVELAWERDEPQLYVRDEGPGFEFSAPSLPLDILDETGRGLFIVSHYASRLAVRRRTARPGAEVLVTLQRPELPSERP